MSQYEQDRREAYADILEDGAMGIARLTGGAYDPETSSVAAGTPGISAVPMVQLPVDKSIRYSTDSLITEKDVRFLVAALSDASVPFELVMGHQLQFAGSTYRPKIIEPLAPDGLPILFDIIATVS